MDKDFSHIGNLLQQSIDNHPKLQKSLNEWETRQVVERTLGQTIMHYVDEIVLKKNLLIIRTNQSVLRHEIQMQERQLLKCIHQEIGEECFSKIVV